MGLTANNITEAWQCGECCEWHDFEEDARECCAPRISEGWKCKPVNTPITRGLLDSFAQELHFSLLAARAGYFGTETFDKIAAAFNVIWGALELAKPKHEAERLVIEGGMRTMNECSARGDKTGVWMLTLTQIATVTAAANKAEEVLPHLSVLELYKSMQKLAEVRAEERKAA